MSNCRWGLSQLHTILPSVGPVHLIIDVIPGPHPVICGGVPHHSSTNMWWPFIPEKWARIPLDDVQPFPVVWVLAGIRRNNIFPYVVGVERGGGEGRGGKEWFMLWQPLWLDLRLGLRFSLASALSSPFTPPFSWPLRLFSLLLFLVLLLLLPLLLLAWIGVDFWGLFIACGVAVAVRMCTHPKLGKDRRCTILWHRAAIFAKLGHPSTSVVAGEGVGLLV